MKKRNLFILTLLMILILGGKACKRLNRHYILNNTWVYDEGFRVGVGDMMQFDSIMHYTLRNDTIFRDSVPRAKVISINRVFFSLTVKDLESGKRGVYINLRETCP